MATAYQPGFFFLQDRHDGTAVACGYLQFHTPSSQSEKLVPLNQFGQAVGPALPGWTPRAAPPRTTMKGRFCHVLPIDPERHASELYAGFAPAPGIWTYLPDYMGPHATPAAWREWLERCAVSYDPLWHTIVEAGSGRAVGIACYLRIDRDGGAIEVGGVLFSPQLQKTPAATEAMYLMMRRAFDELGYRRYEWKCDQLNAPSRAAAERLGFTYEGCFRQHFVYRGRNRDTDWFSMLDGEWPARRAMFENWLKPENFDDQGRQKNRLSHFR
jgi:RimJ/RimL family protein N-acetyltransferase